MSDDAFLPDQPALMGAVRARNIARGYKYLAEQFEQAQMPRQAARASQDAQWWLNYAAALEGKAA
jgi:hypothetical protein